MLMTPSVMNAIFTPKTGFVIFVVASATSSATPDSALTAKPHHIQGNSFRIGASGMWRATPRIRRSIATFMPTTKPRPTVWRKRIVA